MKKLKVAVAFSLVAIGLAAQQDPHFTMYMFNKQVINPGYIGSRPGLYFQGLYRTQWVGMKGAPKTMNFGAHGIIPDTKVALGLHVMNDVLGVTSHTGIYGQYAYNVPMRDDVVLSLGLQAGLTRFSAKLLDLNQPVWAYPGGDAILNNNTVSAWLPNLGAGAYMGNEQFYIGISVPHLIDNYYDKSLTGQGLVGEAKQYKHYFAMAGVRLEASDRVDIQPQIITKFVSGENLKVPFDADFDLGMIFNDMIMFGVAYRLSDSFDAYVRAQVTKNLSIGYAYDLTISELNEYTSGSHEILVGWEIGEQIQKVVGPRLWTF
jgi:type IX secretion system PorP/SprF family membrane protein